jgi:leucyl/phenylalanyl-tRNA--protein transferase
MTTPPDQASNPPIDPQVVEGLLNAYARGLFPMADPDTGAMRWFDPPTRGILPLEAFRVPRSLAQRVRSRRFTITSDRAFARVMLECSKPRPRPGGEPWIDDRIIHAYSMLHAAGHAHSIEAWREIDGLPVLVGGLYGVNLGGLFAGESMFSRPDLGGTDASKVCLVHLVSHLRARGFTLLDTQFSNDHLAQFGCQEITRRAYRDRLRAAVEVPATWEPFSP